MTVPTAVDQLMAEVAMMVRSRRAAGDFPEAFERELDAAFARYAPEGGDGGRALADRDAFMAEIGRAAQVDAMVPVVVGRRSELVVKAVLRRLMAFYVGHVAVQARAFATAGAASLRGLEERATDLERHSQPSRPFAAQARAAQARAALGPWFPLVLDGLAGVRGRVLHAECGDGALVEALLAAGVDAYGVDPVASSPRALSDPPLDTWDDDASDHLAAVSDGGLAGVVLSGWVDRLAVARQRRLAAVVHARLGAGGRLLLVATNPLAWGVPSPEADLGGGHPLHAATWVHLLTVAGFEVPVVHTGPDSFLVEALRT